MCQKLQNPSQEIFQLAKDLWSGKFLPYSLLFDSSGSFPIIKNARNATRYIKKGSNIFTKLIPIRERFFPLRGSYFCCLRAENANGKNLLEETLSEKAYAVQTPKNTSSYSKTASGSALGTCKVLLYPDSV